jgi:hypothetical protein|nr:MAG TPA: Elongation factor P (EF-P) KOW-like domain [Caudoviricetes sp.]
MREFRIKINNEKTYVVKANDYNQAVKTLHSKLKDFDLTNFLALKRSLELRIGEEIDFDKLEEYVNKLPKDKNGKKNVDVKEVIKCCIKAKDNAVSDSISRYTGEDAIRTNGFVKIKEDGDWTSYKYNGSDFDDAVFKIHQYNPSLIAFISNGNKTITVRNKYLNDSDNAAQGEIEVLKSFGFDYKDGRWVKESNNNTIIAQPYYHYVSVIGPGDTEKHCKKYQYQSAGMLKKIIASNIKDSSIKDVSYVSGKNLKIGQKIVEDGEVLEVVDIKETQRGVNNNYRDVTFKNVKTGATETVHFVNSALVRLNDYSPKYNKGQKIQTSAGIHEIIGYDPVRADVHTNRIEYSYRLKTPNGTYTNIPDWQLEKLVELGRYKLIDSDIKDSDSYQVWTINEKGVYHKEADVPNPQLAKAIASQLKKQGRWVQISKNSKTNIVSDCNMMDSLTIKVKLNGKTYKGIFNGISNTDKTFGDVYIPELVSLHSGDKGVFNEDEGRYVSDGKFYFKLDNLKKWNPSLSNYLTDSNITDADPVKVEKIIRKEKSALGVTYYIFQTKSSSGYTIYYQVTDKTYHGEPTYSGGGIISFSLKSANDTLDHKLLADKLKAKYGEKEGTKRYLRGENDSAIKDKLSTSDANSLVEAYIDKYKYTHSNLPYVNKPKIKIFNSPEEFRDKFLSSYRGYSIYAGGLLNYNGYVVKLFTSAKDGKIESPSADNIFTIFPTTTIKDSNNIKNRKSYTIKVGDKQYKVFAESESEAINKYIRSKKQ